MEKHEKNAAAIVELLSNSDKIKTVYYPGLSNHPSHAIAKKQQKGFGGMLSFEIKGGLSQQKNLYMSLKSCHLQNHLVGLKV